jgi:hypothetical protein
MYVCMCVCSTYGGSGGTRRKQKQGETHKEYDKLPDIGNVSGKNEHLG